MINKSIYSIYILGFALYLSYSGVNSLIRLVERDSFSTYSLLYIAITNLLIPLYVVWRLYNFFVLKQSWLPQLEGKKSWYVVVGLIILWTITLLGVLVLLSLIQPNALSMAAIIIFGVASLLKVLPMIFIEIGYFTSRKVG